MEGSYQDSIPHELLRLESLKLLEQNLKLVLMRLLLTINIVLIA